MRFLVAAGAILLGLLSVAPVYAQLGIGSIGTNLSIDLSPAYPQPGDTVRLTLQSTSADLVHSTIVWRVNGSIVAQGEGTDSTTVIAGGLGKETDIEVEAVTSDGTSASAQATIIPTEVDLLFGSDSYVAPFYAGRALPSAGTNIILQAVTRFKEPGGSIVTNSDIVYTWRNNGEVLGSLSGRGRSTAIIPVLHLYGANAVSVEAHSSDGVLAGAATLSIPSVVPHLTLYQDHPLYGIMYNSALGPSSFISESEMTFAAAPFFAQARSANDPRLSYAWSVNGSDVAPAPSAPSEITINADRSSGLALVGLELTSSSNFYLDAKDSWNVTFSGANAVQDAFHSSTQ